MSRLFLSLFTLLILSATIACQENSTAQTKHDNSNSSPNTITQTPQEKDTSQPKPKETENIPSDVVTIPDQLPKYSWVETYNIENSLAQQIPVPSGFQRLSLDKGSFGEWLRYLPLHPKGTKVMLHNGGEKPYQSGAARVINIDIGKADLQQCADAVMRLKAEYHYSQKTYEKIHFNYTSGHKIAFTDWAKGRKPKVSGSKVYFTGASGEKDYSYRNFGKYLRNVFMFAGTASLEKEMKKQALEDLEIGDVFIKGGFPGHAILIVDVAVHKTTGKKIFLLAQSYMPAQSIHILKNFNSSNLSPWYSDDFGEILNTPEWDFAKSALHKFAE